MMMMVAPARWRETSPGWSPGGDVRVRRTTPGSGTETRAWTTKLPRCPPESRARRANGKRGKRGGPSHCHRKDTTSASVADWVLLSHDDRGGPAGRSARCRPGCPIRPPSQLAGSLCPFDLGPAGGFPLVGWRGKALLLGPGEKIQEGFRLLHHFL